jgi:hypothetical protein
MVVVVWWVFGGIMQDYKFDVEDEEEAFEEEHKKEVRKIFQTVARLCPQLALHFIQQVGEKGGERLSPTALGPCAHLSCMQGGLAKLGLTNSILRVRCNRRGGVLHALDRIASQG